MRQLVGEVWWPDALHREFACKSDGRSINQGAPSGVCKFETWCGGDRLSFTK